MKRHNPVLASSVSVLLATSVLGACGAYDDGMMAEEEGEVATTELAYTQSDATTVRSSSNCSQTNPGPGEVYIYEHENYGGACRALIPGFYPNSTNLGLNNDTMTSIKIGSGVRARLFANGVYGGDFKVVTTKNPNLGQNGWNWNDRVSSMRVELTTKRVNCSNYGTTEVALFRDYQDPALPLAGDCVILPVSKTYADPSSMGIANDSVSAVFNGSTRTDITFFWNASFDYFNAACYSIGSKQKVYELPKNYGIIIGPNDQFSSVGLDPDPGQSYLCGSLP